MGAATHVCHLSRCLFSFFFLEVNTECSQLSGNVYRMWSEYRMLPAFRKCILYGVYLDWLVNGSTEAAWKSRLLSFLRQRYHILKGPCTKLQTVPSCMKFLWNFFHILRKWKRGNHFSCFHKIWENTAEIPDSWESLDFSAWTWPCYLQWIKLVPAMYWESTSNINFQSSFHPHKPNSFFLFVLTDFLVTCKFIGSQHSYQVKQCGMSAWVERIRQVVSLLHSSS